MAGYSSKSLVEKLGIKPGFRVMVKNAPEGYLQLLDLPDDVMLVSESQTDGGIDWIQIFVESLGELQSAFLPLAGMITRNGTVWVSWPKGRSDCNENSIREIGLAGGMVDVKVVAIDEIWSGLKFVYRLTDR